MIHIPEGNYLTILEAMERAGASRFTLQKWVEHGLLEVITIPNLGHLVREDTLSEFLKRDQPSRAGIRGQAAPQNPTGKTGWQSPACFYLSLISIFASLMTICSIRECKR